MPFHAGFRIKTQEQRTETKPAAKPKKVIHRVCVTCNNMFRVTPENYESKLCPNCHKA